MENNQNHTTVGYANNLYILPFDHRTGLYREFGWTEPLTDEQAETMREHRRMIYEGLQTSIALGVPKEYTGVLTEDTFGKDVLLDAKQEGFVTILTTEKSGTPFFDFEHTDWQAHIDAIAPTFVKALVRYNPEGNSDDNTKSATNLKLLSDFAHAHGYKLLIEPLVAATETQLASVAGDKSRYDAELRSELTMRMITELQNAGVEADIWKIEGFTHEESYRDVVTVARQNGRDNVGSIVLGRNETDAVVSEWLRAGAAVSGVIGFAVGRTIFLDALKQYMAGEMTREQAVQEIAERFYYFYGVFVGKYQ